MIGRTGRVKSVRVTKICFSHLVTLTLGNVLSNELPGIVGTPFPPVQLSQGNVQLIARQPVQRLQPPHFHLQLLAGSLLQALPPVGRLDEGLVRRPHLGQLLLKLLKLGHLSVVRVQLRPKRRVLLAQNVEYLLGVRRGARVVGRRERGPADAGVGRAPADDGRVALVDASD